MKEWFFLLVVLYSSCYQCVIYILLLLPGQVKHQYRIAPKSISLDRGEDSTLSHADGAKDYAEGKKNGIIILTKAQIFAELEKMRSMTAEEAAAVAARAVAEAEAAIAAAEMAAAEAEEAEIEAEAAQCFADAAQKALTCVSSIHGTTRFEHMDK